MDAIAKQRFIQAKAIEQKIKWSSHALAELTPEGLSVPQIELALHHAEVVEDYRHAHRYLPDCLILTFVETNRPVHAVIAIDDPSDYILIVTIARNLSTKSCHKEAGLAQQTAFRHSQCAVSKLLSLDITLKL